MNKICVLVSINLGFFDCLIGKEEMQILNVGVDAAGKITIFYNLRLEGEIVNTVPTIGYVDEKLNYYNSFSVRESCALGSTSRVERVRGSHFTSMVRSLHSRVPGATQMSGQLTSTVGAMYLATCIFCLERIHLTFHIFVCSSLFIEAQIYLWWHHGRHVTCYKGENK